MSNSAEVDSLFEDAPEAEDPPPEKDSSTAYDKEVDDEVTAEDRAFIAGGDEDEAIVSEYAKQSGNFAEDEVDDEFEQREGAAARGGSRSNSDHMSRQAALDVIAVRWNCDDIFGSPSPNHAVLSVFVCLLCRTLWSGCVKPPPKTRRPYKTISRR